MSSLRAAPSNHIKHPSLSDLFSPSPNLSMLPPSPTSPSRQLLDLKPVVSPTISSDTLVIGKLDAAAYNNATGHLPSPPPQPSLCLRTSSNNSNATHVKTREDLQTSLETLRREAKSRLREIRCQWKEEGNGDSHCNAILASYTLFRKHVNRHVNKLIAEGERYQSQPGPSTQVFTTKRCGWWECEFEVSPDKANYKSLIHLHVAKAHIEPLQSTHCPFKGCTQANLDEALSVDHCLDSPLEHPLPWTKESLRLSARGRLPPTPAPPLPQFASVTPYLCATVCPFRPPVVAALPLKPRSMRLSRSRASSQEHNGKYKPLAEVRDIIAPRPPEVYYKENPGQMSAGYRPDIASSSSIFPNHIAHSLARSSDINPMTVEFRDEKEMDLKQMMKDKPTRWSTQVPLPTQETIVDADHSPLDDLALPSSCPSSTASFVPAPIRSFVPVIQNPANIFSTSPSGTKRTGRSNTALAKRARFSEPTNLTTTTAVVDVPAQGGPVVITIVDGPQYDQAEIDRAAHYHARKKVGQTYGFAYWKARVEFEKRAQELGECDLEG